MKRAPNFSLTALCLDWKSFATSMVVACALLFALFFHGYNIEYLSAALALLFAWFGCITWQAYDTTLSIPKTALAVYLTTFLVWLVLTMSWSPVPHVSAINVCQTAAFVAAFWMFTLAQDRDLIWRYGAILVLLIGIALALYAAGQLLLYRASPRSVFLNINSHAALLNLIALPAAGYLLAERSKRARWDMLSYILAFATFLLVYGIAITRGRAAALSFCAGTLVLLTVSLKSVLKRDLVLFLLLSVIAFGLADLSWRGGVSERMETLYDLGSAGATRFVIWQRSWEMLGDTPWYGIGAGMYSLIWPRYRDPLDSSAGYFVHNDYLQIWIELGFPGLVLLLLILLATFWGFVKLLRRSDLMPVTKVRASGLFCGLLAVALHSFLDFNFYVLSILLVAGLVLARFHQIVSSDASVLVVNPSRRFGRSSYRTLIVLLVLFPMGYLVALGWSGYEYDRALALVEQREFEKADEALIRAERLTPTSDRVLMSRADLYRHLLTALSAAQTDERAALYREAEILLARAIELNPLNPRALTVRGQLIEENPQLAGSNWIDRTTSAYKQALSLNPRFYTARERYAKLLYRLNRRDEAFRLSEEGMGYWYYETDDIVPFLAFAARLKFENGRINDAKKLARRVELILERYGWRRLPPPERSMFRNG